MRDDPEKDPVFGVLNRSNSRIRKALDELDAALQEHGQILEAFCAGINSKVGDTHIHHDPDLADRLRDELKNLGEPV